MHLQSKVYLPVADGQHCSGGELSEGRGWQRAREDCLFLLSSVLLS